MSYLLILMIAAVFFLSAVLPPSFLEGLPLCIFHIATGWDCPGCGLTRAFVALFHGEWKQAISYNALSVPIAIFLAIYALGKIFSLVRGRFPAWFSPAGSRWIGALLLSLTFGQWLFKTGQRLWERL